MKQTTASLPEFRRSEAARLFYAAWVRDPFRTGAIAPSSRWLARLMTRGIKPETAPILELGPGTGVFTDKLVKLGVSQKQITLVEYDRRFAALLQRRFPEARVLCMNAARLGSMTLFDEPGASAAISGLPLLALSYREVLSVLEGAFTQLRPTGSALPIHLWHALSCTATDSRPAGAEDVPCRSNFRQLAARAGISHPPPGHAYLGAGTVAVRANHIREWGNLAVRSPARGNCGGSAEVAVSC